MFLYYQEMITNFYCISLRTQVLILSIIDLLIGCVILGLVVQVFYPAIVYIWEVEIYFGYLLPFIFAVSTVLLQIVLAAILFHAARKGKGGLCRIWILVSTLLLILKSITVIVHLATGNHDHDGISYGLLIDSVFKVYQIIVVIMFMIKELRDKEAGPVHIFNKTDCEMDPA